MMKQDLFSRFLANGNVSLLTPREKTIAERISQGDSYKEIAVDFAVTEFRIKDLAHGIKLKIDREHKRIARNAEFQSLIANLKASKKPLSEIPIDDLFPNRLYNNLRCMEIKTLGDIVAKGYWSLYREKRMGEIGLRNIKEVLGYFGEKFPKQQET